MKFPIYQILVFIFFMLVWLQMLKTGKLESMMPQSAEQVRPLMNGAIYT